MNTQNIKTLQNSILEHIGKKNLLNHFPKDIVENISHNLRDYQKEALAYVNAYLQEQDLPIQKDNNLAFFMATGSGKTLLMASLMLMLYNKGYKNFIFVVNSTTIINKTIDNFINQTSSKYLFKNNIIINNNYVNIKQVNNFFNISPHSTDINILFTTIQSLGSIIQEPKENAITPDDFKDNKIVILADEAHHNKAISKSKQKDLLKKPLTWEEIINRFFTSNKENFLLEFSATFEEEINKNCIYKYDLKEFNKAKYSKDINLILVDISEDYKKLMLLSILINYYRQCIAIDNNIFLKPVILFKAQTIPESKKNYDNFINLIQNLAEQDLQDVFAINNNIDVNFKDNKEDIFNKALNYFNNKFSLTQLLNNLKAEFKESNVLNVNYEDSSDEKKLSKESLKINKLINSLEEPQNNIRAIFSVNKLNEGWDVLNLFDIVRLYNVVNAVKKKTKEIPISQQEAQLIGRGARYYPFTINGYDDDKYTRKFDNDNNNDLKILESMYYFSIYNSKYISELKESLKNIGIQIQEEEKVDVKIKDSLVNKLANHFIYTNSREKLTKQEIIDNIFNINDNNKEDILIKDFQYSIAFNSTQQVNYNEIIQNNTNTHIKENEGSIKTISISDFQPHIIKNALLNYDELNNNTFIDKLIKSNIAFKFSGDTSKIDNIVIYKALCNYFSKLKPAIKQEQYKGSLYFKPHNLLQLLKKVKSVKVKDKNKFNELKEIVKNDNFFIYDSLHTDSGLEEIFYKAFKDFYTEKLKGYSEVYLIRNMQEISFATFKEGQTFYPDFILILKDKSLQYNAYQVILEQKGKHLESLEQNKADFLEQINTINLDALENNAFKIIALPFYTNKDNTYFDPILSEINNNKN